MKINLMKNSIFYFRNSEEYGPSVSSLGPYPFRPNYPKQLPFYMKLGSDFRQLFESNPYEYVKKRVIENKCENEVERINGGIHIKMGRN